MSQASFQRPRIPSRQKKISSIPVKLSTTVNIQAVACVHEKNFRVLVEKDEDGYLVATVPTLPGCHTQARSMGDLLERVKEAIEAYIEMQIIGDWVSIPGSGTNYHQITERTELTETRNLLFLHSIQTWKAQPITSRIVVLRPFDLCALCDSDV